MVNGFRSAVVSTLEPQAQSIIEKRYAALRDWIRETFADHPDWHDELLQPDQHCQLQTWLAAGDTLPLKQQDMRSLAERLVLFPVAEQTALQQCYQQGCFDRPKPHPTRIDRPQPYDIRSVHPDSSTIFHDLQSLFRFVPDKQNLTTVLVKAGMCRNRGNAQAVAALVEQRDCAAYRNQLRALVRSGHVSHQKDIDTIVKTVRIVFQHVSETEQRVLALVQTGVCSTPDHARIVVERIEKHQARSDRYDATIRTCLERGLFKKLPARLDGAVMYERIAAIFTAVTDETERMKLLLWAGICTHEQQAQRLLSLYGHSSEPSHMKLLQDFWNNGLLDMPPIEATSHQATRQQPYAMRPPFHEVEHHVAMLCRNSIDVETQVQALIAVGCCRDEDAARQVVDALDRREPTSLMNRIAASLAHRICASYTEHGLIGLLTVSDYAPADMLFFVQRAVPYVTTTSDDPAATLALLQRDLVALYRAFEQVDSTLWKRDLLDAPVVSENRTQGQQRISAEQRAQIIAALQAQHIYPEDEATTILTLLVERSGFGIIDWRCGVPFEQAGHAWEKQRLRRILEHHLGALKPEALNHIELQVHRLKEAMQ